MIPMFPYIDEAGVHCKGCRRVIAPPKGACIVGPEYVDLILKMEHADGRFSYHSTPMCRDCAAHVDLYDANDLYLADLAEWGRQNQGNTRPDVKDWLRAQVDRRPVEVMRAAD